jgi:hypothetical protein
LERDNCKEMLQLELSILKPKRILFLTGMKHAQDFLNLSDCKYLEKYVCPLGEFSVNPKKYPREELVNLILEGFRDYPS